MDMNEISWTFKHFNDLSALELYEILSLRNRVFVVEQHCMYNDTDNKDLQCRHLLGIYDNRIVAYARILAPGISYPEPSIGRAVTDPNHRGRGLGRILMKKALSHIEYLFPGKDIKISAQVYLVDFYTSIGFIAQGEPYPEDDIPHIEMIFKK